MSRYAYRRIWQSSRSFIRPSKISNTGIMTSGNVRTSSSNSKASMTSSKNSVTSSKSIRRRMRKEGGCDNCCLHRFLLSVCLCCGVATELKTVNARQLFHYYLTNELDTHFPTLALYDLLTFIWCGWVFCVHVVPSGPEECSGSPRTEITCSCEPPCAWWELNRGPLEGKLKVLFSTEPSMVCLRILLVFRLEDQGISFLP